MILKSDASIQQSITIYVQVFRRRSAGGKGGTVGTVHGHEEFTVEIEQFTGF